MGREMKKPLSLILFLILVCVGLAEGEQTVFGKIEEAHRSGEIDRATELLYKLYAVKAPDRLPERYRSEAPALCATVPMLDVWRNVDLLVKDKGEEVYPLLTRPTGLDSIINTTHFKFHWTNSGSDSVGKSYVDSLTVYAESSWSYEVDYLNWDAPPADYDSGGDNLYDIYVFDIPIPGVLGYVQAESIGPDPQQEDAISWMAIDYNMSSIYRKSTLAHEFNHSCQFSYSYKEKKFWYENCAVWAQDEVYDGEDDYTGFLGGGVANPLTRPEWSITVFQTSGYYQYGGVTWPKYLAENNDVDIVRKIWDLNATHWDSFTVEDTDSILKMDYSDSLTNAIKEYAVWRYFTGSTRAQNPYYEEGSSWTTSYVAPEHTHSTYPASGDEGTRPPDYYGINFIEFDTTGFPGGLNISFDGEDGYSWAAMLIEYNDGAPSAFSEISLDANGSGNRLIPWDTSQRIVLIPCVLSSSGADLDYTYSASFIPTDTDTPYVEVVYPNGGESLSVATTDTIRWIATDSVMVDSVSIYYSTNGGSIWSPVATGEENDSSYTWLIPNTLSSNCLVRISAWDWTAKWDEDTSDAVFAIGDFTVPSVTVIRPNGGEDFGIGSTDTVRWDASDNVGVDSIGIYYSTDAGGSWGAVSTGEANDGEYLWLVPNTPSDSCLVRVVAFDPSLLQGADTSDNFFTIGDSLNPVVDVIHPNGGESLAPGTEDTIRWVASDDNGIDSVNIYYSTDDGSSWIDISHGEVNDSTYAWTVPNTPSDSCRVRIDVFDPAGNPGSDISDNLFTILDTEPPIVTVTSPNGGEQWEIGDVRQITWVATDNISVDSLSVFYSFTGGMMWILLSRGEPNDSSYDWTVFGPPSDSCLMRIIAYDYGGSAAADTSDSLFQTFDSTFPSVLLLYPNGGEVMEAGGVDTIRWTASDNYVVDSINIYYSSNGGGSWDIVSTGEPNDSSYEWSIPSVVSDSCLVRVLAVDGVENTSLDESDSLFSIADSTNPSIQVISPNGGEVWGVGDEDTIRWVASDVFGVDSVNIYYSTNNGGSWFVVSRDEPNDSSYVWTIPDMPSDSCLVRIRAYDPNNHMGTDVSDDMFAIRYVGVEETTVNRGKPDALALSMITSNPFKQRAVFYLALPQTGNTRLDVYDITGGLVGNVFTGHLESGYHSLEWSGDDAKGNRFPSGVYFFRLESVSGVSVTKGILLGR
ncbi:hypothetical protein E3J62_07530 [candidate division TA06 bacterium]|uniref:FlgD/Vpr Ig-like domain-containing protein n=1 Tax=candidate division TA06 bacterium TaxID=2250710 RepID=A0A523USF9_UNCT6|nr:MAG: hypothetical protein E3J62_07530 [candidate division TA06 bacterium]